MPANLLVLPLLGGFLLVHIFHYLRFRAQRLEGYRLLIESAIAGTALLACSRLLIVASMYVPEPASVWVATARTFWTAFSPIEYSGTATGALLLGLLLPLAGNALYSKEQAKKRALRKHSDPLFKLLHDAATEKLPIAVTMDNRKWYAGLVMDSPSLDPQEAWFKLLPVFSGYRESESLKVKLTVYYRIGDKTGDTTAFAITLPLRDVKSAHRFDPDLFFGLFGNERPQTEPVETVTLPEVPADIPETHYS